MQLYLALIHKDPGSDYGVSFPDFPGCVTAGATLEEAYLSAYEALQFHVDGMVEDGEQIPAPSRVEQLTAEDREDALVGLVSVRLPGKARRINITMDENLLSAVDQAAAAQGMNRSSFLAEGVRRLIRETMVVRHVAWSDQDFEQAKALAAANLEGARVFAELRETEGDESALAKANLMAAQILAQSLDEQGQAAPTRKKADSTVLGEAQVAGRRRRSS